MSGIHTAAEQPGRVDALFPQSSEELNEVLAWLREIDSEGHSLVDALLTYIDADRGGLISRDEYAGLACTAAEDLRKVLGRWKPTGWGAEVRDTFYRPFYDLYEAAERLATPATFSTEDDCGAAMDRFEAAYSVFRRESQHLVKAIALVLVDRSGPQTTATRSSVGDAVDWVEVSKADARTIFDVRDGKTLTARLTDGVAEEVGTKRVRLNRRRLPSVERARLDAVVAKADERFRRRHEQPARGRARTKSD